MEDRFLRK